MECKACQNSDPEQFLWVSWKPEWNGMKWGGAICMQCKSANWFPPNSDVVKKPTNGSSKQ